MESNPDTDYNRTVVLFISSSYFQQICIMLTLPAQRLNPLTRFLRNIFKTSGVNISFKIF